MGRLKDKMRKGIPADDELNVQRPETQQDDIYEDFTPSRDSFVTRDIPQPNDENYYQQPYEQPENFQNIGGEEYYEEALPPQRINVPPPPPSPPPYEQPLGLPQQQYSSSYSRDQYDYQNPLAILDEIKKRPTPKGAKTVMIGGRPIDLHALEDYVVRVSPYHLRTILRYHNARTIEEIKNYSQRFGTTKIKGSMIILILLAVGMGVLGIIMMLYMPDIMAMFQGGL